MELAVWQALPVSRGATIQRLRIERGLTQAELAELADYDGEQLGRLERDKIRPHGSTWKKLADALSVDLNVVLGETPSIQSDAKPAEVAQKPKGVTGGSVQARLASSAQEGATVVDTSTLIYNLIRRMPRKRQDEWLIAISADVGRGRATPQPAAGRSEKRSRK